MSVSSLSDELTVRELELWYLVFVLSQNGPPHGKVPTLPSGGHGGSEGGGEEEKIFRHYEPFVNTLTGKHRTVQLGHL